MALANAWDHLAIERCRYGLMLDENGVTARLAPQSLPYEYYYRWLQPKFITGSEWLQCERTDMELHLTSVTTQWISIAPAGPNSRLNHSAQAPPHMGMAVGKVADVHARIFRISFSGELQCEINVPAGYALRTWQTLLDAGASGYCVQVRLARQAVLNWSS
ncbi:MAG: hypothetical protein OEU36_16210 [Gammaproteobacteria bacterium]|nr:hypothetical protein [Gammaproteobacteria bacterium]